MPIDLEARRREMDEIFGGDNRDVDTSPTYLNSFENWLDGPINENSWNWVKDAYNRSLQGLTDKMIKGKERYELDPGYSPNVVQDIASTALSFSMPLDFLAMAAGGTLARGGLALAGITTKASQQATKLGVKALIPQMTQQAGSLAVYEGALGGVQAAIDGGDIMSGITEGAMHGGVLGGIAGGVGGGLAFKNAEKIRSLQKQGKLSSAGQDATKPFTKGFIKGDRASLIRTGIAGQIAAESGVFTAAEQAENIMNGNDFRFGEALKSYAKNIGLFGVLKAKSKVIEKTFSEGRKQLEMLEAAEREKILEKEGESYEARAYEGLIQNYKEKEKIAREEGNVAEANKIRQEIDSFYEKQSGVNKKHTKAFEDFQALKTTLNKIIKDKGEISESTLQEFILSVDGLITVAEKNIKNATDANLPFYKTSLKEFKNFQKTLENLSESTIDSPHGKQTVEKSLPLSEEIIRAQNKEIIEDAQGNKKEVDIFNFEKEGLDLSQSKDRIRAEEALDNYRGKKIREKREELTPLTSASQHPILKEMTNEKYDAIKEESSRILGKNTKETSLVPAELSARKQLNTPNNKKLRKDITEQSSLSLSSFAKWAMGRGRAEGTSIPQVNAAAKLVNFLKRRNKSIEKLEDNDITDFFKESKTLENMNFKDSQAIKFFLEHLDRKKFVDSDLIFSMKELQKDLHAELNKRNLTGTKAPKEGVRRDVLEIGRREGAKGDKNTEFASILGAEYYLRAEEIARLKSKHVVKEGKEYYLDINAEVKKEKSGFERKVYLEPNFALSLKSHLKAGNIITTTKLTQLMRKNNLSDNKEPFYDLRKRGSDLSNLKLKDELYRHYMYVQGHGLSAIQRKYETNRLDSAKLQKEIREQLNIDSKPTGNIKYQLESISKQFNTSVKELKSQVKYFKELYPELDIQLKNDLGKFQGEYVLGRITGQLVEIAKGRAKADTIPHEVSHHVVDILRAFGDKKSKNLIKEGESKFGGEEGLVQAVGEYALGRMRNKSKMNSVKNWLQKFWSNIKIKLNMHNEADVARILGEKVLSGKMPKNKLAKTETKFQLQSERKEIIKQLSKIKNSYQIDNSLHNQIKRKVFGTESVNANKITLEQVMDYNKLMSEAVLTGKAGNVERLSISNVNEKYAVSLEASKQILKLMGVKDGLYENASKIQAMEYSSYIRQQYDAPILKKQSVQDSYELSKIKFDTGLKGAYHYISRGLMPVWLVLKKYGGNPGKKISDRLLNHEWAEHVLFRGPGDREIAIIKARLGKQIKNIHLFDAERATRNYKEANLTPEQKTFYENVYIKKNKNSNEYIAHQTWKNLSEKYWKMLKEEIKQHQTPEGARKIIKELDKKQIDGYMTRRLSLDALKHVTHESNFITNLVEKSILKEGAAFREAKKRLKDGTPEEIARLEERLKDISTKEGQKFYEDIRTDLYYSIVHGYTNVKNPHLIERAGLLPEYIEVNVGGKFKKIKTYEDSYQATAESYVTNMSKFLASVRYFPEWTGLGSKYKIDQTKRLFMEQLETNPNLGTYAMKAIKRQIGADRSDIMAMNMPAYRLMGQLTNTSAVAGLSSPLSGLKNLMIGIPRSIGGYGFTNTLKGIKAGWNATWNPLGKVALDARKSGALEYGSKTLELETAGFSKINLAKMFRFNLMTQTENFNRIVSAEAGKLYFAEAQSKLRGEVGMFKMGTNKKRMKRLMEELWHLDAEQINFLEKTKDFTTKEANPIYTEIMHKVGHFSHVSSQGGTSAAILPLWMSSKELKPFTLFQRMAASTTIDTYRNFVLPAVKYGNFMPLARAALAHSVSGAALYALYDELFGKIKPTGSKALQDDRMDGILLNLWRSEFFGVFGELFSPYEKDLVVPISTPIVIRNVTEAGNAFRQVMLGGKTMPQAAQDYAKNTFVLWGQVTDAFPKANTKDLEGNLYYRNFMKIRAMKHKWTQEVYGQSPWDTKHKVDKKEPYYRKLKYAMMFGSEVDIAKEYWKSVSFVRTEMMKDNKYIKPWKAHKDALKHVESVIKSYDPYKISEDIKGTAKSKKDQFLEWLGPENRKIAIEVKKQYEYKQRQYNRIIRNPKYKNSYYAYAL